MKDETTQGAAPEDFDTAYRPASGAEAPPQPPFYTYPQPAPPQKVRRVGTFTMGLALVTTGIITLLYLFNPAFDILTFARLAPAVLIFLGIEILISNFAFRNEKLKYDFLSTFVCFLLIAAGVGAVAIPPLYEQYGPQRYRLEEQLSGEVEQLCFARMKDIPNISSMNLRLNLNGTIASGKTMTVEDLTTADYLNLYFDLMGSYKNKAEFAAACKTILDRTHSLQLPLDGISFSSSERSESSTRYELSVHDLFQKNLSAAQLEELVSEHLPEALPEEASSSASADSAVSADSAEAAELPAEAGTMDSVSVATA